MFVSFMLTLCNQFCFYSCIVLIVWWCFYTLTTCHLFILRCLMHVKLNVIKLFNRLSLLANQNTSTSMQQSMSIVSQPVSVIAPVAVINNHCNHFNNHNKLNDVKDDDTNCQKCFVSNNNLTSSMKSNNHQKFIMSSSFQLHEDDLSKIDVKSLVSIK